jgi:hypothetical protein
MAVRFQTLYSAMLKIMGAVIKRGLRMVVELGSKSRRRFRLKTITTKGEGLAVDGDWSEIRSMIYEGHGG